MDTNELKRIENIMHKYEYAKEILETQIDVMIKNFTYQHGYNPVEHVKGRIKSEESIKKKLERHQKEYTDDNIIRYVKDVVGVRIVCSFLSDVYDIVYLLTHTKNIIIKDRKDYISNPKNTGYMSYHLHVLIPVYFQEKAEFIECEIQVRTMAMDFWASLDHKISYKFQDTIPEEVQSEMYDYAKTIQNLDKKMLDLNRLVQKYRKDL